MKLSHAEMEGRYKHLFISKQMFVAMLNGDIESKLTEQINQCELLDIHYDITRNGFCAVLYHPDFEKVQPGETVDPVLDLSYCFKDKGNKS